MTSNPIKPRFALIGERETCYCRHADTDLIRTTLEINPEHQRVTTEQFEEILERPGRETKPSIDKQATLYFLSDDFGPRSLFCKPERARRCRLATSRRVENFVLDQDGNVIFSTPRGTLYVIDARGERQLCKPEPGRRLLAVAPDGQTVYTIRGREVHAIRNGESSLLHKLRSRQTIEDGGLDPSGRFLFLWSNDRMWRIDLETGQIEQRQLPADELDFSFTAVLSKNYLLARATEGQDVMDPERGDDIIYKEVAVHSVFDIERGEHLDSHALNEDWLVTRFTPTRGAVEPRGSGPR